MAEIAQADRNKLPNSQKDSSPHANRLKRRTFLAMLGAVGGRLLFGAKLEAPVVDAARSLVSVSNQDQEVDNVHELTPRTELTYEGITLFVDSDGIPLGYQLQFDFAEVAFSQEDRAFFRECQARAMTGEDFVPAHQIEVTQKPEFRGWTIEHPYVFEQPAGVLSDEDLENKGVAIINPQNDPEASALFFREAIFDGTRVLEPFQLLRQNSSDEEKPKIEITVLNTGLVKQPPDAIDSNTGSFRPDIKKRVDSYRNAKVFYFELAINVKKNQLIQLDKSSPEYVNLQNEIYHLRCKQLVYVHMLSDAELLPEVVAVQQGSTVGRFMSEEVAEMSIPDTNTALIEVCAPELQDTLTNKYYTIGFQSDGSINFISIDRAAFASAAARIDQSYPSPAEFRTLPPEADYYYDIFNVGFVLYHELAHLLLVDVFPKLAEKGLLEKSEVFQALMRDQDLVSEMVTHGVIDGKFPPIKDEKTTDKLAMLFIKKAHEVWAASGYKNDSGFAFLFKVPANKWQPAGYQITKSQNTFPSAKNIAA